MKKIAQKSTTSSTKKNRFCPYRKTCPDVCYGDQPCEWALAFDKMARKLEWWKDKAEKLETELKHTEKPVPRFYGEYVFAPCQNAFNGKTSWWLSKKDCTVALYCFTAATDKEVDSQLADSGAQTYIEMYEKRTGTDNPKEQMMEGRPAE